MPGDDTTTSTVTATAQGKAAENLAGQWGFGLHGNWRTVANMSGIGVVIVFAFLFLNDKFATVRSDTAYYQAELAAIRKSFDDRLAKQEESQDKRVSRQWENQMKMAEGLNNVAIALARIEALLHVRPESRPPAPAAEPPKPIQLKPPA